MTPTPPTPKPLITIIDEPKETHPLIIRAVVEVIRRHIFGPSMRPTLKQRLTHWPSYDALLAENK